MDFEINTTSYYSLEIKHNNHGQMAKLCTLECIPVLSKQSK